MRQPEPLLLTYSEAAELLACSRMTVCRLVTEGKLHVVGRAPGRYVTRESIERYCGVTK